MARRGSHRDDAIALAERLLSLLDEASITATYKYAVLLALIDVCLENTGKSGAAPDTVTTWQLADKVLALYWPHTVPYVVPGSSSVLLQNRGSRGSQAKILTAILKFRSKHAPDPSATLHESRLHAPQPFERLVQRVELSLIEMPLPRLQVMGPIEHRFLYDIGWTRDAIPVADVRAYQRTGGGPFDNRILFRPGVGDHLVRLSGLLRPLIHRHWAATVARINDLEEARLEGFLFGVDRIPLDAVRPGLRDLQSNRCFYCDRRIAGPAEVDHFVPWSRYPDNGIHNLVVADGRCNGSKSDHLVSPDFVARWHARNAGAAGNATDLAAIADAAGWQATPARTLSVARAIYLRLPDDSHLWHGQGAFVALDRPALVAALAAG